MRTYACETDAYEGDEYLLIRMTLVRALVPSALICAALMGCGSQPAPAQTTDTAADQTAEATTPEPATSDYVVVYSDSELFSKEDEEAAIDLIMAEFKTWQGCTMKELVVADDTTCAEQLEYANSLKDADAPDFDQAMLVTSTFHSPSADQVEGTAWEADKDYEGYTWTLARTNGGSWELLTWGYA